jgi:hypothetical protein
MAMVSATWVGCDDSDEKDAPGGDTTESETAEASGTGSGGEKTGPVPDALRQQLLGTWTIDVEQLEAQLPDAPGQGTAATQEPSSRQGEKGGTTAKVKAAQASASAMAVSMLKASKPTFTFEADGTYRMTQRNPIPQGKGETKTSEGSYEILSSPKDDRIRVRTTNSGKSRVVTVVFDGADRMHIDPDGAGYTMHFQRG